MVCVASVSDTLSQHRFRSLRRHTARLRQEAVILQLRLELAAVKHELDQWQVWWWGKAPAPQVQAFGKAVPELQIIEKIMEVPQVQPVEKIVQMPAPANKETIAPVQKIAMPAPAVKTSAPVPQKQVQEQVKQKLPAPQAQVQEKVNKQMPVPQTQVQEEVNKQIPVPQKHVQENCEQMPVSQTWERAPDPWFGGVDPWKMSQQFVKKAQDVVSQVVPAVKKEVRVPQIQPFKNDADEENVSEAPHEMAPSFTSVPNLGDFLPSKWNSVAKRHIAIPARCCVCFQSLDPTDEVIVCNQCGAIAHPYQEWQCRHKHRCIPDAATGGAYFDLENKKLF